MWWLQRPTSSSKFREQITVVCVISFATSATHSLYLILSKNHWSERWKLVRDIWLGYLVLNSVFLIWWGSCTHESQKYAYLNQRDIMAAPVDMAMYRRNSTSSHPLIMRCRWSITVERRRIKFFRGQALTQFVLSQVPNSRHMHTWALLKWLNNFLCICICKISDWKRNHECRKEERTQEKVRGKMQWELQMQQHSCTEQTWKF